MERDVAELVFMRDILPEQIASSRHLICTAAVAMQTTSRPLYFALKDTLTRERRFPASLFFALRGAFRHRNLHLFRVNDPKGQDFVMLKQPVVLDPAHTAPMVRDLLTYVNEHPTCTKAELVTALAGTDEAKLKETLTQLVWLVEKGHVIEYYNDVLSAPIDYPAFRFLPGEKQQGGAQPPARRGEAIGVTVAKPPAAAPAAAEAAAPAEETPAAVAEPSAEPVAEAAPAAEEQVAAPAEEKPAAE
jgi:hypothetical protein